MNKAQVIQTFWASFGYTAYDENTVPIGDDAPGYPYITYSYRAGDFGDSGYAVTLTGSVWTRSTSWAKAEQITEQIAQKVQGLPPLPCDNGYVWIRMGNPFQERLGDPSDDMVRRMRISLDVKFITTY